MKYIRTKDKVIDLTSKQVSSYEIIDDKTAIDDHGEDSGFICVYYFDSNIGEHIEYDNKGGHSMDNWYLKDIIAKADTIEELCDAYVDDYIKLHKFKIVHENNPYLTGLIRDRKYDHRGIDVYGAIWTDKGLIYVAKMNEKGELELL